MATTPSYIFGGTTGETPESIRQKRQIADMLLGQTGGAKNWGEGFNSIAKGLVSRWTRDEADEAQAAGDASADPIKQRLIAAITGQGAPTPSMGTAGGFGASAAAPQPTSFSGDQQEFVNALLPGAIEASQRTGIDPRIIVAQAAQESGWGKHAPGNNLFGIKSHGQPGGQNLWTNEEVNGQNVRVKDSFRAYDSPGDSISGYADFMLQNPRYKPFMGAQGLDAQLEALGASGYATDSNYANSVGAIARGLNLPDMATSPANAAAAMAGGMPQGQLPPIAPSQPQQVAQAAPMPPQSPAAAAPTPFQTAQGPSLQMLMEAASNQFLMANPGMAATVNSLLAQEMQKQDPRYQIDMQLKQAELAKANAGPGANWKTHANEAGDLLRWDDNDPNAAPSVFYDAPDASPSGPDFGDTAGVRKEIQALPSYKNYAQALPIYRSMVETAGRDTKASDLNLVYGLGKIMDPTSVVREGEMVMVQNASSLPDWVVGAINSVTGGAKLTPETRKAILEEAYGRVTGYDQAFQQDTSMYQGIAERNMINPADIIPNFGSYDRWQPTPAPEPAVDTLAPSSAAPQSQPRIVTQQDYQSLPSGSPFIADGDPTQTVRIKP